MRIGPQPNRHYRVLSPFATIRAPDGRMRKGSDVTQSIDDAAQRVAAMLARYRPPVIAGMREALARDGVGHARYMRYHLGWEDAAGAPADAPAGKMLRPAFCLLACEATGGDIARAMPAAIAIELLHNFTLIHDDIEDRSYERHGRPTLWRVAGIEQAINAGDGMFVMARREMLGLRAAGVPDARVLDAIRILDDACVLLCEGQYADIGFEARDSVTRDEYDEMIGGKTAALLGASAAIGALAAGADDGVVSAFGTAGLLLGLAFQVQDDVLGVWGESAVTGKPVADDIRSKKKSFPIVYAFEALAGDLRAELAALYAAPGEPDVPAVLGLLEAAGAREAATSTAKAYASRAIAALAPLDLAPDPLEDIVAMAAFFVHRTA